MKGIMKKENINKLIKKLKKFTIKDGWGYDILELDWDNFKLWLRKELKDLD